MNKISLLSIVLVSLGLAGVGAAHAEGDAARGEYLLHAGGCISCHTMEKAGAEGFLAGGRALETPFGVFYTPNITPDPDTGIGHWSDADFIRALSYGFSPRGEHYYPAFPYTSYAGMTRRDMLDLKAYIFTLPAIKKPNQAHELVWYAALRFPLRAWKARYLDTREFHPDPSKTPQWNRGAYLVRHLGHCGECHTPRDIFGGLRHDYEMAGNPDGPEGDAIPNITPHREDGIGRWSVSDIDTFLELGMLPDGDFAGSLMTDVIDDNTAFLTPQDRKAVAVYLKSLPDLATPAD